MIAPTLLPPPESPTLASPETFIASDGYEHAWRFWPSAGRPRGLIVALHGIQSHSGWYGYSAERLAEAGFAVAYLDRRGSGLNFECRGDAPHAERLVNDVVQFTHYLERWGLSGLPRWLAGTSWGGKLGMLVAARRPDLFDGIVLQCPGIHLRIDARGWQKVLLSAAQRAGASRHEISIPLDDAALFCDAPHFQDYVRSDPLSLRRVTIRFLNASVEIDGALRESRGKLACPILTLLAGRDRIVNNRATREFVASCGSPEQRTLLYPEACHTLEFAESRDAILADLVRWLEEMCPRRAGRALSKKAR